MALFHASLPKIIKLDNAGLSYS